MRALVREPGPELGHCELTFIDRTPLDWELALRQHRDYVTALRTAGADVTVLPALPGHPDAPFVEDTMVALDGLIVPCRPAPLARRAEVGSAIAGLPLDVSVAPGPPEGAFLEGGDVLVCGRRIMVGRSTRTNDAGVEFLRRVAEPLGYTLAVLPVARSLHLKTAVTLLDEHTLLANTSWVDLSSADDFDVMDVPAHEPFAANVLKLGALLVAHSGHAGTIAALGRRGYRVATVDIGEFLRAEAGVTCLSVIF